MTTVLDVLGVQEFTDGDKAKVADALRAAGLKCEPPFEKLHKKAGTVCLSLPAPAAEEGSGNLPLSAVRVCSDRWEDVPSGDFERGADELLWLELDVLGGDEKEAGRALRSFCSGLSDEVIRDLYLVDVTPKVHSYEGTRAVSAVAVSAQQQESAEDVGDRERALAFQMVEIVAGDGWLITAWHRERRRTGIEEEIATGAVPDAARQQVRRRVESRWRELGGEATPSSGDLGVLILEAVTDTYENARMELSAWLDEWELAFYKNVTEGRSNVKKSGETESSDERIRSLVNLRALVHEFRRCVAPLDAPDKRAQLHWFADVSQIEPAENVDRAVDSTVRALDGTATRIRGGFDMAHLRQTKAAEKKTDELQNKISWFTVFVGVPAAVAAFFGANTWLPGGNDQNAHASFDYMLIAIGVLLVLALVVLRPTIPWPKSFRRYGDRGG